MIGRHKKLAALAFLAWLCMGVWDPQVGGPVGSAAIGVFCVGYVVRWVRAVRA